VVARGRIGGYDTAIKAAIPRVEEALDKLSIRGVDTGSSTAIPSP